MTDVRVAIVDVYALRFRPAADDRGMAGPVRPRPSGGPEVLVLRRAPGLRSPGTWETVHGHVADGESPVEAALRELREETGLAPSRLYNLSRVETFYLHQPNLVALIPAFCAIVPADAAPVLSEEHDVLEWLEPGEAARRFFWPREKRALADALQLFGSGDAGGAEDVLRIL
ncbi:MAG TPA: NUDIX domain-containing protein [Gemmatimonadales bacterium]|nr:NUDIX domain-containing protein [Gemmatimonadales bacterium]